MRIFHCIPTFETGGAQRQLSYLAPALRLKGHEIHVAYLHGGPNLARLTSDDVILHKLRSGRGNHDPGILLQLAKLFFRLKPQIVQSWLLQMDVLGGIAARLAGLPWIISERSSAQAYPPAFKNTLRLLVARGARAIVSNSSGGDAYWASKGHQAIRYVVKNGIPVDGYRQDDPGMRSPPGISRGEKVILFAGRFEKSKNIEMLVDAFAEMEKTSHVKLMLCGDGPCRADIEARVAKAGLSGDVLFPGFSSNLSQEMKRADVFVSLSGFEGFPNVVIEAMACGCPLVVSDILAHREFLDDRCAVLVNPSSREAVRDALSRTLAEPGAAKARADAAMAKASRWTVSAMADAYEQIYREVSG